MTLPPPLPLDGVLRLVRTALDTGWTLEQAIGTIVPSQLADSVRKHFEQEQTLVFRDANVVEDHERAHIVWLPDVDRAKWYYWKRMRDYMIDQKGWTQAAVRSIDDSSDKVLGAMENPIGDYDFRTRGLVVGYVQSGKTANYSALIAKAADAGYRLFIVLTGIHNSLRQQTQRRLASELTGKSTQGEVGVGRPTPDRDWFMFTTDDLARGDFNPGHDGATALSSNKPILIVTKKNYTVLNRLLAWLDSAHRETLDCIPTLVIDDEADQASPNTGGNRSPVDTKGEILELTENDSPSKINLLIRSVLKRFKRVAYVAYTATPFANVLIDPDAIDTVGGDDLYPRSFIVSLPKPVGYYGAEEIFGSPSASDGMDILRPISDDEAKLIGPRKRTDIESYVPVLPTSLRQALDDFILGGAARAQRGDGHHPATMLIHPSQSTQVQLQLTPCVAEAVAQLRDQWRYYRDRGMTQRLQERWETDFRRVTRCEEADRDVPFDEISPHIGPFLEQIVVKQLNYGSDDELDYERDPGLKVVVVGGNRLSRGLTLEGLLVSYYVRTANAYDTLMQMGRWFGYRKGYGDLTRIYTTDQLKGWFRDLAGVEQEVRTEIARYEVEKKTPMQLGVKIKDHPGMMVTSRLKMKAAELIRVSFEDKFPQTVTFPLAEPDLGFFRHNLDVTRKFLSSLGPPNQSGARPLWRGVPSARVIEFLDEYLFDPGNDTVKATPLKDYIRRQNVYGELTQFCVAVVGQEKKESFLGDDDLGIIGGTVNLIERTRLITNPNSVKGITSQYDQKIGLTPQQLEAAERMDLKDGSQWRAVRPKQEGLLLVYPISKNSGYEKRGKSRDGQKRQELFADENQAEHVIGIALSFPPSTTGATGEYWANPIGANEE